MKKVKKNPNCCSYNSPGFTYSQPFQTDAQIVFDLILSYEHPPNGQLFFYVLLIKKRERYTPLPVIILCANGTMLKVPDTTMILC